MWLGLWSIMIITSFLRIDWVLANNNNWFVSSTRASSCSFFARKRVQRMKSRPGNFGTLANIPSNRGFWMQVQNDFVFGFWVRWEQSLIFWWIVGDDADWVYRRCWSCLTVAWVHRPPELQPNKRWKHSITYNMNVAFSVACISCCVDEDDGQKMTNFWLIHLRDQFIHPSTTTTCSPQFFNILTHSLLHNNSSNSSSNLTTTSVILFFSISLMNYIMTQSKDCSL